MKKTSNIPAIGTKTVAVKSSPVSGWLSLAQPGAKPGHTKSGAVIYHIVGIPEGVTDAEVLQDANRTVFVAGHTFRWSDLGQGRIINGIDVAKL